MKNKALIAILVLSGMFFATETFAIKDIKKNKKQKAKTEEAVFAQSVADVQYNNNIHSEFSLEDCIRIAIKNNLSIQSSELTDVYYKEKIGEAWSKYFPELSGGVSFARTKDYQADAYNAGFLPTVSANMMIFDFGKTKATADSAKSTYKSKVFDTKEHINGLICDVKRAYYNLLFAQAQYDVYVDTVKDFELQLKQAESMYKAGKKAKVDVAIADYNLCKAQYNFEKAKNTLKVARLALSRLMGFPKYSNYVLTTNLGKELYSLDFDKAINLAYDIRPELLSAKQVSEAAKLDLRAKRRDFTPNINISASYGNMVGTYKENSFGFGANLTYNNLNMMKTKKLINQARIQYEKSKIDYEDTKQALYFTVNKAYENFITARNSIGIAENALEQAKEQYRQTKGRYRAGVADIIELKDGENAYLNARLDYYNSLLNYNVALAEFEMEIGAPIADYSTDEGKEL